MSTALKLTTAEYEQMVAHASFSCIDRRIELIKGELREMSPAGPVHDDCIEFLLSWAAGLAAANQCKIRCQSGLLVGESVPEPDFMLLAPQRYGRFRPTANNVLLLVEVADSSLSFDLGEKAEVYAKGGVREYWVIDVAGRKLHRHQKPAKTGLQQIDILDHHARLSPAFNGEMEIPLSDLFLNDAYCE